jgi:hypothetical protein
VTLADRTGNRRRDTAGGGDPSRGFAVRDAGAGATEHWWALARRAGDGEPVYGRVVAVHERTLTLAFERDEGGALPARVVTLGRADVRPGPLLARVSGAGVAFDRLGVESGTPCRVTVEGPDGRDPVLRLSVGDAVGVTVDTRRLSVLPAGSGRPRYDAARFERGTESWQRHRDLLAWLRRTGHTDGLGWVDALDTHCRTGTDERVAALVENVVAATREGRLPSPADSQSHALLGLGPGSTPAGDDLLAGLLFALRCVEPAGASGTVAYGRTVTARARDRTTVLSAALLAQAARGRATAPVRACLADLTAAGTGEWPPASVESVLEVGHTSGPATLAGLLTATLAVCPRLAA